MISEAAEMVRVPVHTHIRLTTLSTMKVLCREPHNSQNQVAFADPSYVAHHPSWRTTGAVDMVSKDEIGIQRRGGGCCGAGLISRCTRDNGSLGLGPS